MPVCANANGCNDRNHARGADRINDAAVDRRRFANKAQIDIAFDMAVRIFLRPLNLRCGNKAAVFAGYAKRLATSSVNPADQFFVDRARKHHFSDLGRFSIGDAQTVDKLAFNAQFFEHGTDLRAAAMDDDGVNTDSF